MHRFEADVVFVPVSLGSAMTMQACCASPSFSQLEETEDTAKAVRAEPFGKDSNHSRYYSFSTNQEDCWVFKWVGRACPWFTSG